MLATCKRLWVGCHGWGFGGQTWFVVLSVPQFSVGTHNAFVASGFPAGRARCVAWPFVTPYASLLFVAFSPRAVPRSLPSVRITSSTLPAPCPFDSCRWPCALSLPKTVFGCDVAR